MADRHNEVSGTNYGTVVQVGGDVRRVEINPGEPVYPPLTSWTGRPPLTPALTDLLNAQHAATESLPYTLLGVKQPELTRVYVQQTMRPQLAETDRKLPDERSLTVTEALNRERHMVITGEPGAGKSTLGHMYVQRISDHWLGADPGPGPLSEPVLPLRIPARALASENAWSELLAAGTQEALGRLLSERPRPELFARRALGARWLVFIDGLDEITAPDIRRQVIQAIAYQVRRTADHRLVITTRPLPGHELKPLEELADTYAIQPFGPVELDEFAKAWFRAQDPLTATTRAAGFVRQVGDGRLRDLVRNPLLATIAAITHTLEPHRPLPNNRVDLYDHFMNHLLADKPSGRNTVAELRKSRAGEPNRLEFIEWLHARRADIITHLAIQRLETETPLFDEAHEWVTRELPSRPDGWEEDLRALLDGVGVFVRAEDELRFLHHSFAEFLAARQRAAQIEAEFPGLTEWIERGEQEARQTFVLFTFVLWGRRPGHDIGLVLRRMLDGTADDVLLAGRLLAEGVGIADDLVAAVVERMVDLVRANGTSDNPWLYGREIGRVLASFGARAIGDSVLDRLRELRDRPEIAEATRIECAVALGHFVDPAAALRWLEDYATRVDPPAVCYLAKSLVELAPDGAERAERLITRMAAAAPRDRAVVLLAVESLQDLGRAGEAARLVRDLVRLIEHGEALSIRHAWETHFRGWDRLVLAAAAANCAAETLWAARKVFGTPGVSWPKFSMVVQTLLAVCGVDVLPEIVAHTAGRSVEIIARVALDLGFDHRDAALELARRALRDGPLSSADFGRAAAVLLTDDSDSARAEAARAEAWTLVDSAPWLTSDHLMSLAIYTDQEDSRRLARRVLADPAADELDFGSAAEIMLTRADPEQADEVTRAALDRPAKYWAAVVSYLFKGGFDPQGTALIDRLLESGDAELLLDAARELLDVGQSAQADRLLAGAAEREPVNRLALADLLASAGRPENAIAVARVAFTGSLDEGSSPRNEANTWLAVGGVGHADEIVATLLASDTPVDWRMEIAELISDSGLLDPAVRLWLDVVRYHGDAVGQGVEAAARLVKCGHRDDTIAMIERVLADERLSEPIRVRMRALLAWVVATVPE